MLFFGSPLYYALQTFLQHLLVGNSSKHFVTVCAQQTIFCTICIMIINFLYKNSVHSRSIWHEIKFILEIKLPLDTEKFPTRLPIKRLNFLLPTTRRVLLA